MTADSELYADLIRFAQEQDDRPATEPEIQAALADPTFAALAAKALGPYEHVLTAKAKDEGRRTLAVVFVKDPGSAALLARVRAAGPGDASATVASRSERPALRRRGTKP